MPIPPPPPPPPARKIVSQRYRLLHVAGRGGMATVWRAETMGARGFKRPVAVKEMHEHLLVQPLYVAMFCEEARVGATIDHPNVARTYDFVQEDDKLYIVCEWVEGVDLSTYIHSIFGRGSRTRWELVAAIGVGLLHGVAAAHERTVGNGTPSPVVHRDMSPHNILIDTKGVVKLIDFGLCLAWDRREALTQPGVVKGKMAYLSPEIVGGQRPSPLSDQFSVATVLWEALVGRKLFDGANDFEIFSKVRDGRVEPLRPRRPDLPARMLQVINRALAVEPTHRFPSARDMARELGEVLKSTRTPQDLHAMLAESVADARTYQEVVQEEIELGEDTPLVELADDYPVQAKAKTGGLWHRLKNFGRG